MAATVVVLGSINIDQVIHLAKLPGPGETVGMGGFSSCPGGKGSNQAAAAHLAGASVRLYGFIGDDMYGQEAVSYLKELGVDLKGVLPVKGAHTGIAQIVVDDRGENQIAVAPGANFCYDPSAIELPDVPDGECWVALFQNEIPQEASETLVSLCKRKGMLTVWNSAPHFQKRPAASVLADLDFLICNQGELEMVAGPGTIREETDRVLSWGVKNVIVTLGARGSCWAGENNFHTQEAFTVQSVDTVGAGDCFCGVFATALAEGHPVKKCLGKASAAAALSITRKGAQTSFPTASEVARLMNGG